MVDSSNRPMPAKVTNNGDGTHRVDYTPQLQGPLSANVMVAGKPVPRSPFKVCSSLTHPTRSSSTVSFHYCRCLLALGEILRRKSKCTDPALNLRVQMCPLSSPSIAKMPLQVSSHFEFCELRIQPCVLLPETLFIVAHNVMMQFWISQKVTQVTNELDLRVSSLEIRNSWPFGRSEV